ncbi:MAG TPA: DnaA N-terminal domain-containing protein [Xanthobacteraceae bacterium]|nr:DnaA N-terminal domain-containing protein [Xanthobacteraceae bacterium]
MRTGAADAARTPLRQQISPGAKMSIAKKNVKESELEAMETGNDDFAGRWERIRRRLRAEVGEDVYNSWFARVQLVETDGSHVRLSVPTRFLKSWLEEHHSDRLRTLWLAEMPGFASLELQVRSAVMRVQVTNEKPDAQKPAGAEAEGAREQRPHRASRVATALPARHSIRA